MTNNIGHANTFVCLQVTLTCKHYSLYFPVYILHVLMFVKVIDYKTWLKMNKLGHIYRYLLVGIGGNKILLDITQLKDVLATSIYFCSSLKHNSEFHARYNRQVPDGKLSIYEYLPTKAGYGSSLFIFT